MKASMHGRALIGAIASMVLALGPATLLHGASQQSSNADTKFEFAVAGMSCTGCARSATEVLRKIDGVRKAKVDFKTKKASVETDGSVTQAEIREALGNLGFEALFAGESAVRPLTPEERKGLDIEVVSQGEAIDIQEHLPPGKVTIFDFFAEWCGPCHLLTPKLEHLVKDRSGVALRKVDISDWKSPAGKQATEEFGMPGLPYIRVYDDAGRLLGSVHGNHIDQVEAILKGRKSP